jgi:hypothetical protein
MVQSPGGFSPDPSSHCFVYKNSTNFSAAHPLPQDLEQTSVMFERRLVSIWWANQPFPCNDSEGGLTVLHSILHRKRKTSPAITLR